MTKDTPTTAIGETSTAAAFMPARRGQSRDLSHDIIAAGGRLEPSPELAVWLERERAWLAAVEQISPAADDAALEAEAEAWTSLIRTDAPSLRALLMKLEAVLACHLTSVASSMHSPEDTAALASELDCTGPAPLVAIWRDLQRLVGVTEPLIPPNA